MADPKKILFWPDVYKEQGHWLPSRPLKRSLCERKIRTFAFFVHSVPQKAKTV